MENSQTRWYHSVPHPHPAVENQPPFHSPIRETPVSRYSTLCLSTKDNYVNNSKASRLKAAVHFGHSKGFPLRGSCRRSRLMRRRAVRFELSPRFRAETRSISKAFGLLLIRRFAPPSPQGEGFGDLHHPKAPLCKRSCRRRRLRNCAVVAWRTAGYRCELVISVSFGLFRSIFGTAETTTF